MDSRMTVNLFSYVVSTRILLAFAVKHDFLMPGPPPVLSTLSLVVVHFVSGHAGNCWSVYSGVRARVRQT